MKLCEERVQDHTAFNQSLEDAQRSLEEAEEQLRPLKDVSGDRPSVNAKLAAVEVS